MMTVLLERWPLMSCVGIVLFFVVAGSIILLKYEGQFKNDNQQSGAKQTAIDVINADGNIFTDELWTAGGGRIHPGWLLGFRVFAFVYLLPIQLYNLIKLGAILTYFYYTQWTFTLLTAYFGLAACISAASIFPRAPHKLAPTQVCLNGDTKQLEGDSLLQGDDAKERAIRIGGKPDYMTKHWYSVPETGGRSRAGIWGYSMQVVFQVVAPAVLLTDGIYWLVLIPFVLPSGFKHDFVDINMHAVNAIFLFIELFLNDMRFPWFRGAYMVMWSAAYVFFQWSLHLMGSTVWPYPFLNLSTPYAPVWYFGLSLFHLICFVICLLLAQAKQGLQEGFLRTRKAEA